MRGTACQKTGGKRLGALLFVCALTLSVMFPRLAMPATAQAIEQTVVRIAAYPYSGYFDIAEDGTVSGYGYDYLLRLASYAGWNLEFVTTDASGAPLTYAKCLAMVEDGSADIASNVKRTEETEERFHFSERAAMEAFGTLTCRQDDDSMTEADWSSFEGKRIGILDNSARNAEIKEFFATQGVEGVEFVRYQWIADLETALVDTHEIDAIYNTNMRNEAGQKLLYCMNPEEYYFICSKDAPDTAAALDSALERLSMEDPGFATTLCQTWYPPAAVALSLTAEERAYIEQADTITIAASSSLVPIEYYDEGGECFKGLTVELYDLISAKTGLQFSFVARGDVVEQQRLAEEGSLHMLGTLAASHSVADETGVILTSPVYVESSSLVYRIAHVNDASTDKIALIENYPYFRNIAEKNGYTDIVFYPTFEECIRAVDAKKVDATLIPSSSTSVLLGHSYYADLASTIVEGSDQEFSLGVFKGAPDATILLTIINKALASISDDTVAQIRTQQTLLAAPKQTFRDFLDANLWAIVLLLCLAVLLVVVFSVQRQRRNQKVNALLEKANAELQQAADARESAIMLANQANLAKTEFLSRVSHEVRTPMNAIIGLTTLMEGKVDDPDYIRENLERVNMSSQFMLSLIDDILDISRIESGRMVLAAKIVSMRGFLDSVGSIIADRAHARGVRFSITTPDGLATYYRFDPVKLQQVLVNILGNAVKFTDPDGEVSLTVEVEADAGGAVGASTGAVADVGGAAGASTDANADAGADVAGGATGASGAGGATGASGAGGATGAIDATSAAASGRDVQVAAGDRETTAASRDAADGATASTTAGCACADEGADELEDGCDARESDPHADDTEGGSGGETEHDRGRAIVRFTMTDTGIGIAPEFIPHLFEAFVRENTGTTSSYDGTGLGLAISNNIITLMGGTIDVQSTKGKGSTFIVTVPLELVDEAEVADGFSGIMFPAADCGAFSPQGTQRRVSFDFSGKHALLVDDNEMNRLVANLLLEDKGFEVEEAINGLDAVERFAASETGYFDVILMDIRMPKMDGMKAAASIRSMQRDDARSVPIIAMTADAFQEDVIKAKGAGMNDHLAKPLIPAVFYKTIARYM